VISLEAVAYSSYCISGVIKLEDKVENFVRSRISAGLRNMAGFWFESELKSDTAVMSTGGCQLVPSLTR